MSYIDTSIIVAALDPADPRCRHARSILEDRGAKIVSALVLAELASVLARRKEALAQISGTLNLGPEEAIIAALLYVLRRFDLRYRGINGVARLPLIGGLHQPIAAAIELSPGSG